MQEVLAAVVDALVVGLVGYQAGSLVEALEQVGDAGMLLGVGEEVVDQLEERKQAGAARVAERAGGRPGGGE